MGNHYLKNLIWVTSLLFPLLAFGQKKNTDCRTAIVICSDSTFAFLPSGRGIDDFLNLKNDQGCLDRRENISAWFYFELREDMPLDSNILYFKIQDEVIDPACRQDYDFAIYGANLNCDSLSKPLRCTFARLPSNVTRIETGMRPIAQDSTEDFLTGDGWIRPLKVKPGDGFFLLVDFFVGACAGNRFDSTKLQDFLFDWGGAAAPWLNCIANPNCDQVVVSVSNDTTVCAGTLLSLAGSAINTNKGESYIWTSKTTAGAGFLTKNGKTNAKVDIPLSFSGRLVYYLKVKEGRCEHTDSVVINVLPSIRPTAAADTLICRGATTNIDAQAGFAEYRWSNSATTRSITVPAGTYTVTVSNPGACPGSVSVRIQEKQLPKFQFLGDTILCPGEVSTISIPRDTFVTYSWSNGSTTASTQATTGGVLTLNVTDREGCPGTARVNIIGKQNPVPVLTGLTYFCAGGSVRISNEQKFVSYRWSNNTTGTEVTLNRPGAISLEVTDSVGCVGSAALNITERTNPVAQINGIPRYCTGGSTILSADAGFTYRWSTGSTTSSIPVSTPGQVGLTITDAFGCQGNTQTRTDSVPLPKPRIAGPNRICAGETARYTTGNFATYRWSTGSNASNIGVTVPGTIGVTVTSPEGCQGQDTIPLVVFQNPIPDIDGRQVICPGERTTLRTITPYATYQWSNGANTSTVQLSQQGGIRVRVVDVNGCRGTDSIFITQAPRPIPSIQGPPSICAGESTLLSANQGYSRYRWSRGDTIAEINITTGGTFRLSITDNNGCQADTSITVLQLANPKPDIQGDPLLCRGTRNTLLVNTTYDAYLWSNGQTTQSITVTAPGVYTIQTTFSNGCRGRDTFNLVQVVPRRPRATGEAVPLCEGKTYTFDPGPGFIRYTWSDNSTNQILVASRGGDYRLEVVDSNRCVSTATYTIIELQVDTPDIAGPSEFCSGNKVMLLAIGADYQKYQWSTGATTSTIEVSEGGTYAVSITDRNGCEVSNQRPLLEKQSPKLVIDGDLIICNPDSTTLQVTQGLRQYFWTTGDTSTQILVRRAGNYGVQAVATNGCIGAAQVEVVQSRIPYPVIGGDQFFCDFDTLKLELLSGFPIYRWTTGSTTNKTFITTPGFYGVTVEDELGCRGLAQIKVEKRDKPKIEIKGPRLICPDEAVELSVTPIHSTYRWSNGDTLANARIKQAGTYSLDVIGTNGCPGKDTFLLRPAEAPKFQIRGDTFFCVGGSSRVEVTGGFIAYNWRDGNSSRTRQISTPGIYFLRVQNENGCFAADSIRISEIPLPLADAGPDSSLTCIRTQVQLGGPGSSNNSLYQWTGPGTTAANSRQRIFTATLPGTYNLIVTDAKYGCISPPDSARVQDLQARPQPNILPQGVITCSNPTAVLQGVGADTSAQFRLQWLDARGQNIPNAQRSRLNINRGGTYTWSVLNTATGCAGQASIRITPDTVPPPAQIYGALPLNCLRDSVTLFTNEVPAGSNWTFNWSRDAQILGIRNRQALGTAGLYRLSVLDLRNGCRGIDSVNIRLDTLRPDVSAGPDFELDCTEPSVLLRGRVSAGSNFRWFAPAIPAFSANQIQPSVNQVGIYLLEATNPGNGCRKIDTVEITQYTDFPRDLEARTKAVSCPGRRDGSIRLGQVQGGEGPLLFRLGNGNFVLDSVFNNLPSGLYQVTVQDARGCEYTEEISVDPGVNPELFVGPDQTIKRGQSVRLQAVTNLLPGAVKEFRWFKPDTLSCDTCRDFRTRLRQTTEFQAMIIDTNGCEAKDKLLVIVEGRPLVYVPNAFTPANGDGLNDEAMVFANRDVTIVRSFRIFDRWGEKVFEKLDFPPNNPAFGWNGLHNGTLMMPAAFAWTVEVEYYDGERELFFGDLNLIR
jgi:trimeric autotransporter adhesin